MDKTRIRHAAQFAKAAYVVGQHGKTARGIEEADALVADTGFRLVPGLSNANISTFRNASTGAYHIAHKGTQVGASTGLSDLIADAYFADGRNTAHVTSRTKTTERIIDRIDPGATITMSGHSLGGHTASYAMANSDKVATRVSTLDTFDAASNPIFGTGLSVSGQRRAVLDNKVTHHRMNADVVSKGQRWSVPFGEAVTYKLDTKGMGTVERALYAHDIGHFTDGELVAKGEKRAQEPEPEPAPVSEPTLHTAIQDTAASGNTSAPYVDARSLCRQYPQLPECKAFI
jgi:hypothetical protein